MADILIHGSLKFALDGCVFLRHCARQVRNRSFDIGSDFTHWINIEQYLQLFFLLSVVIVVVVVLLFF